MGKFENKFKMLMESMNIPENEFNFRYRIDGGQYIECNKAEFIDFVNSISDKIWKNYDIEKFLNRVFQDNEGYYLDRIEFNFETKNPSANICWKPINPNYNPIQLYFFL
jgi:hypothetical protein